MVVSHNLGAVRNLCSRVLVLHDGTPRFLGGTDEAISIYHEFVAQSRSASPELQGALPVEFAEFTLLGPDGTKTSHLEGNDEVSFRVRVKLNVAVEEPAFSLTITTEAGIPVYGDTNWQWAGDRSRRQAGEEIVCDIRIPARLTTGSYTAVAGVMWDQDVEKQLSTRPIVFYVSGRSTARGIVDLGASFSVEGAPSDAGTSTGTGTAEAQT
jgi:hypothetical protein